MPKETLEDYANELFEETQVLKKQLQQYKSIVKAVDPDNLPEGLVLALNESKQGLIGDLFEHSGSVICDDESINFNGLNEIFDTTHYIETKDIIKMMGDL